MSKRTLTALAFALAALPAFAQNTFISSSGDVSLSAAYAVTLQQPALTALTGAKPLTLVSTTVFCTVAATVTHSSNGTAATATAGTPVAQPGNGTAPATATFWVASNTTPGTTLHIDHVPAGTTYTYVFPPRSILPMTGAGSNYTLTLSSLTGTCNVSITHTEPQ